MILFKKRDKMISLRINSDLYNQAQEHAKKISPEGGHRFTFADIAERALFEFLLAQKFPQIEKTQKKVSAPDYDIIGVFDDIVQIHDIYSEEKKPSK